MNLRNYVIQITSSLQDLKHVKRLRGSNYTLSREIQTLPGACNVRLKQCEKRKYEIKTLNNNNNNNNNSNNILELTEFFLVAKKAH